MAKRVEIVEVRRLRRRRMAGDMRADILGDV